MDAMGSPGIAEAAWDATFREMGQFAPVPETGWESRKRILNHLYGNTLDRKYMFALAILYIYPLVI